MHIWARELLRGPVHLAPRSTPPTVELVERVVEAAYQAGYQAGRADRDAELVRALGIGRDADGAGSVPGGADVPDSEPRES